MTKGKQIKPPSVVGMGLITLDLVEDRIVRNDTRPFAGGTCGNVLAILSYLGWESVPLSRLLVDCAGSYVSDDLRACGVSVDYLSLYPQASTPIIVQKLRRNRSGDPSHSYSFVCPKCDSWLPQFRPVLNSSIDKVVELIESPRVFFFDRVSRSSLTVAEHFKNNGSVIYFEPSGVGQEEMFNEAVKLSDIVKYASNRGRRIRALLEENRPAIEIETLGSDGIRYRSTLSNLESANWTHIAPASARVVDASGAGDWFTSGMIDSLFSKGTQGIEQISDKSFKALVKRSQEISALSCGYVGPRGLMYEGNAGKADSLIPHRFDFQSETRTRPRIRAEKSFLESKYGCPKCCPQTVRDKSN